MELVAGRPEKEPRLARNGLCHAKTPREFINNYRHSYLKTLRSLNVLVTGSVAAMDR